MKRTLAMAFAIAVGVAGLVEASPPAAAAGAPAASVEQVRADALARLAAGDVQTVRDRHHGWSHGRHNGWSHSRRHDGWRHRDRHHRYRGTDVWGSLSAGGVRRHYHSHRRHHW